MKVYGILFCSLFLSGKSIGQEQLHADSTILFVGTQVYYGFIIPHRSTIRPLVEDTNPWGFSAEISRLRYTRSSWNTCNCYSQNGFALTYFNFDNRAVLGSSISLVVFAEPQLSLKNLNVSLRAGLGPSYITKVYHWESNPENVFFSSRLSGILLLQLTARYWLNENFGVHLSAGYHHISNGGMQQPNLGMNFPTASIGLDYGIGRIPMKPREKHYPSKTTLQYFAGLFFTTGKVLNTDDLRKPILGLMGGLFKPFARMHGMGVGVELVKDWSIKERNRLSAEHVDHYIFSGLVTHHFLFGKFDFSQAIGVYLYKEYTTPDPVFQRYALMYRLTKHVEFGFSLKAHLAVAEQMDLRVNYLF